MSAVSHLTVQSSSGRVVRLDDLRTDKAHFILHVYIEKFTKQVILKLQYDNKTEKETIFVFLPVSHRDAYRPFSNLTIFKINSKEAYYKFRYIGQCVCPTKSLLLEVVPLSSRGFVSDLGGTF